MRGRAPRAPAVLAWAMAGWVMAGLAMGALCAPALAQDRPPKPVAAHPAPLPRPAPKGAVAKPVPKAAPKPVPKIAAAPLPLPRPHDLGAPPVAATAPAVPQPSTEALAACLADFKARGGEAMEKAEKEPDDNTQGACAIPGPVTFSRVHLADGATVTLESAVTVRCTLALELASWLRDDISPIARRNGTELTQVTGVGGHACRPRNNQAGAQISEHASGNAFDLLGFKLKDGRVIALSHTDAATTEIRKDVQKSACARFLTVLGPGADSSHADHVHLDMRQRRAGFRICQWNVD